ncbi:MAG: vitamin B12 dependent-methionine synthase activation domain-containing protein [Pseudomonadota bacterium]
MKQNILQNPFYKIDLLKYSQILENICELPAFFKDIEEMKQMLINPNSSLQDQIITMNKIKKYQKIIDIFVEGKEDLIIDNKIKQKKLDEFLFLYKHFLYFHRELICRLGKEGKIEAKTLISISTLLNKYLNNFKTSAIYSMDFMTCKEAIISFEVSGISFKSESLARFYFKNTDSKRAVIFFIVSLGEFIDEEINRLIDIKNNYEAYILNGLGSSLVDCLANDLTKYIMDIKLINSHGKALKRFSPGYGDFALNNQREIFKLLNPSQIGVFLNDNMIMVPEKSVSGLISY